MIKSKNSTCHWLSQLHLVEGMDGDTHIGTQGNLIYDGRYRQTFPDNLNSEIKYEEVIEESGGFSLFRAIGYAVAAVAVVAVVSVAIVATGGLAAGALIAAGAVKAGAVVACAAKVAGFAIGATGAVFVGSQLIDDIQNQRNSSFGNYMMAAVDGMKTGAIIFALKYVGKPLLMFRLLTNPLGVVEGIFGLVSAFGTAWVNRDFATLFRLGGTMFVAFKTFGMKEPVDVVDGIMFSEKTDFELPGPIPFEWSRTWYSDSRLIGQLGHSTRHSFEVGIQEYKEDQVLVVYLSNGVQIACPTLVIGEEHFNYQEKILLTVKSS